MIMMTNDDVAALESLIQDFRHGDAVRLIAFLQKIRDRRAMVPPMTSVAGGKSDEVKSAHVSA